MLSDRIKRLQAAQAKVSRLEKTVAAQLRSELKQLPSRYGFSDVRAFVKAVLEAGQASKASVEPKPAVRRRSRAIITNATRAAVKSMAKAGKTEGEIARAIGISPASVHSIKKSAGLVKPRKRAQR